MKNASPANVLVQTYNKKFKEEFGLSANNYSTEAIIGDEIAERLAHHTKQHFGGRDFKSLMALHKACGEIVKDETDYIHELVKQKNWTSASKHLKDLFEKGRINIQEFKAIDTQFIQPLEKELRKDNDRKDKERAAEAKKVAVQGKKQTAKTKLRSVPKKGAKSAKQNGCI